MTKNQVSLATRSEVVIRSEDLQKEGQPKGNALSLFSFTGNIQDAITQAIDYQVNKPRLSGFKMARRV